MILVNFSHPLTGEQQARVEQAVDERIKRIIDVPVHFDDARPFAPQVATLIDRSGLSAVEWQTLPLLINLPSYAPIVAMLLAYLHGLCGYFPTVLRLKPTLDGPAVGFDIAEVVALQQVRDAGRRAR